MAIPKFTSKIEVKGLLGRRFGRRAQNRSNTEYDYTILVGFNGRYPKKGRGRGVPVSVVAQSLIDGSFAAGGSQNRNKRKYIEETVTDSKGKESTVRKMKRWDFVSDCIRRCRGNWRDFIRESYRLNVQHGFNNIYDECVSLGNDIKKDMRVQILSTHEPPIEENTKKRKADTAIMGASKPLVETGRLLDSITVFVKKTSSVKSGDFVPVKLREYNKSGEFAQSMFKPKVERGYDEDFGNIGSVIGDSDTFIDEVFDSIFGNSKKDS